ncbi:MAG: cytochrome c biogenesis protein CcsA [Thiothrix sp.]|nr:cytochrome c biogenesis protein CcsA [Thiothrix sp.]HPQ95162.1 cytochrome c biogenesis protein CcsA [Thiolinea sp.]
MTNTLLILAILAWLATWLLIAARLWQPQRFPGPGPIWGLALILHGLTLLLPGLQTHGLAIDFFSALSLVMWLASLILFFAQIKRPLASLGLLILPFTLISLLLDALLATGRTIALNEGLGLHILLSLLAYSMLMLAALQSILLAVQNHQLHNHQSGYLMKALPPLQDMESLLFQLILTGVVLLTLGLISGLLSLHGLFGQGVAHKTVLSLIAWAVFTTLLIGHWQYGWRGRIAVRWTLSGFTLLMLGFFGSKFVLEYMVHKI